MTDLVVPEYFDGVDWQEIASKSYVDSKIPSSNRIVVSQDLELTPITDGYRVGLSKGVKLGGGQTRIPVVSQNSSIKLTAGMLQFVTHQS